MRAVELQEAASEAENAVRIAGLRYEEGEEDLLSVLTIQQCVIRTKSRSLARRGFCLSIASISTWRWNEAGNNRRK